VTSLKFWYFGEFRTLERATAYFVGQRRNFVRRAVRVSRDELEVNSAKVAGVEFSGCRAESGYRARNHFFVLYIIYLV
jgi:hypothetical protein